MSANSVNPVCFELRIEVQDLSQKQVVVETLLDMGESAFVEGDTDCDIFEDYDQPIGYLGELTNATPIVFYSEDEAALGDLQSRIADTLGQRVPMAMTIAPIANQDWRESWKESFRPIHVDGVFVILPPWEDASQYSEPHRIIIDPGMAFGTGQHETTRLCLSAFAKLMAGGYATIAAGAAGASEGLTSNGSSTRRVFDVGTGSGILAMAARMLGVPAVVGCDIDAPSIDTARLNAEQNGIDGIEYFVASPESVVARDFDVVLANIQSKPLKMVFAALLERLNADGWLILSGLLLEEAEEFEAYVASQGLGVVERLVQGDWIALVARRSA